MNLKKILIASVIVCLVAAIHIIVAYLDLWVPVLIADVVILLIGLMLALSWEVKQEAKENIEFWKEVGRKNAQNERTDKRISDFMEVAGDLTDEQFEKVMAFVRFVKFEN